MDFAQVISRLPRRSERRLGVVDSHTCGQPTRVILSGAGLPPGMAPDAARRDLAENRDWIRRVAVMEPRGHRSMFVAALIEPAAAGGDYGVAFMDANAYPDMCGHATIGVATTLIELGLVGPADPDFSGLWEFGLRTPAGRLSLQARIEQGRCAAITFQTPFAYAIAPVQITLPDGGLATVDIAYGGQWYGFLPAAAVGLTVAPDQIDALIAAAVPVRAALSAAMQASAAPGAAVPEVGNIVWTDHPRSAAAHGLNVPVSVAGSFDRSPCGTATCARMAVLVAQQQLQIGTAFVNEGIMGTVYTARAAAPWSDGNLSGIVPEVTGSAWLTLAATLCVDPFDPLGLGYLIGGGKAALPQ